MNKKIASIVFSFLTLCSVASANQGVAFVHGTGSQTDAFNDYWTGEFVNSVRQGLPNSNNYTVINCDFDQFMWVEAAAGCLASQLNSFISSKNISELTLITHSNGGNVVRWILSNPTYDSRYPQIVSTTNKVIALAPSSGGTPLADAVTQGNVFETSLGWILGFDSDAVKQQQVAWMAYYNDTWLYGTSGRPSLPSTFKSVIGSDVDSAIWDGDSYCGGYFNQVALETTQNWLNSCSDGFLECSSQSAAGTVWFTDKQRTKGKEPLSHQQSRRKCFNLDTILRNDI
ncbi:esterase/lipase family protein [Thalassotalea euphylliae]|uniref:esterase/lipase family protein n=1 Tax=Thalassotalea euphylliae TaxID=1655234 RepID=UPI0036382B85